MMTLWSVFRSPLMIGANLPDADDLLLKLLTNDEVLEVNQHCTNGREVQNENGQVIWLADMSATDNKYIALFNLGENAKEISVDFSALGLGKKYQVRDLWEKKDLGNCENGMKATVPAHGSKLYRLENM
jgi:alpha-galactosidase